jgi:hypothetical protein
LAIEDTIKKIQGQLRAGSFGNEASVSNGAVLPILNDLGWQVFDTAVVCPQYPVEPMDQGRKKWVDFALRNPNGGKAVVFVEVKDVGKAATGAAQLFGYAFHEGVPLVVLTDGREWSFYLPAGSGSYEDRRVYRLDLLEHDLSECSYRLKRYLAHIDIVQGKAFESARADYADSNRQAEMQRSMPEAWRNILENPDESLVNYLAEKVEELCGLKPDLKLCAEFISNSQTRSPAPPTPPLSPGPSVGTSTEAPGINRPVTSPNPPKVPIRLPGETGFILLGQTYRCSTIKDVLISVFEKLAERDEEFPRRFADRPHGTKRRYLAQSRQELFPDRPDLQEEFSYRTSFGWYIGTHHGRGSATRVIHLACEVAQLEYDQDLILNLG